jgi:ubiquinone/menaquinone biosynthesis C-methylase UbiE/uncharacterized protein YbaR (Trm112 family)
MRLALLDVLRCPAFGGRLEPSGEVDGQIATGDVRCAGCGHVYPVEDGMPQMLHDGVRAIGPKRRKIAGWVELAKSEGWYTLEDEVDLALPYVNRDLGWDDETWRANEHSFSLLLQRFAQPGMRVLEVGAAKCWAAQHLIRLGCDYVGSDIVVDPVIGLGRGALYEQPVGPFERVQADVESLPFADGSFDLVFCVAALHRAIDLPRAVRELARVTRRGGVVAALNEGTRPLTASGDFADQAHEKALGINEHVHLLSAYLWSFVRARLVPVRVERAAGYEPFAGRTRVQRLMRLPGGRTALTVAYNLFLGYGGISIYARKIT